eukprot:Tamp_03111.p1 GENE.Tamp_03111~~Tamp_03111.p1  ORF type:complete len:542 (+),score=201.62 Tamp_03111:274-1899(+)
MSRTPTVLRQGAHLKPIGSQTPEPRTNPGVRREASMESPLSLTSPLRKKPAALARLADKSATYGGEMDGMGSWEWMDESERQKMSMIQAKEHRKYIQHAQRELHRQREMVANLRAENATLRGKYQSILAEQNDVLDEKHTQHVNHLMNLKYEIEEQVEGELERFDQLKRQLRLLSSKVKNLTLADKSNLYDEREHERTRKKHEDKVEMWKLKHSEEVTHGKALRVVVDDLRHDKMNVKRKIQGKTEELAARSAEAVQLINIANEFYSQRQRYRLVASDLIAEAGKEAEEHRAKMQEISNRIDYYDLVMQEREEDYQKMLLDAERQAANLNDPSEEMKEAEKKRQQELVEAFDKLMYASGVWDVDELVTRFLRKEEKMSLAKNYLDALTEDAEKIERDIKTYRDEASSLLTAKPEEEAAVVALKENISAVEAKSAGLRQQTEQTFQMLEEVGHVLGVIKKRMAACPALDLMRPVKRRWALLRANLQRVPLIAQRPRVDASKVQQGLSKAPPAKFDPRRKTILEELTGDAEAGSNGVEALTGD